MEWMEGDPIRGIGAARWCMEDDNGRPHSSTNPNTLYVRNLIHVILSPKNWVQSIDQSHDKITAWEHN